MEMYGVVGSEVERKPIESKITVELACNLLVPDAAAAPPPSPLSLHLNDSVYVL